MGNKRRKASIIIVSVIVAAFAFFSAVYSVLGRFNMRNNDNVSVDAATSLGSKKGLSKFSITCNDTDVRNWMSNTTSQLSTSFTCEVDNGIYAVILRGGDGGGVTRDGTYYRGGRGAVCMGFENVTNGSVSVSIRRGGKSYITTGTTTRKYDDLVNRRGGYRFSTNINFCLPSNSSTGEGYVGGGGAIGYNTGRGNSFVTSVNDYTLAAYKMMDATFLGFGSSWESVPVTAGYPNDNNVLKLIGSGRPACGSSLIRRTGSDDESRWDASASDGYASSTQYLGGGGAGYGMGCGADAYDNASLKYTNGGGGSCSPNLYPLLASDACVDSRILDIFNDGTSGSRFDGGVYFYRIDPSYVPTDLTTYYTGSNVGGKIQMTNISSHKAFDYAYIDDDFVNGDDEDNGGMFEGIRWRWVYSRDNGSTWVDSEQLNLTQTGTYSIKCRLAVWSDEDVSALSSGTYHMKYEDPTISAKDLNYVLSEKTITVVIKGQPAEIATAPTFVDYNQIYTGNEIKFITKAASGKQGSTTGTTVKYRLTQKNSNGTYSVVNNKDWNTNYQIIGATAIGEYQIEYKASGNGNAYIDGSVYCQPVKIGYGTIAISAPPGLDPGRTYDGQPLQLIKTATTVSAGTPNYLVMDNSDTPTISTSGWKTSISDTTLKRTNAGTYTVWCYINGGTGYTTIQPFNVGTVVIGKQQITIKTHPKLNTADNLKYDGINKNLLIGGITVDQFSTWNSSTITAMYTLKNPSGTVVVSNQGSYTDLNNKVYQVGTYTIEYYVKANNSNYSNSELYQRTVEISKDIATWSGGSAPIGASGLLATGATQYLIAKDSNNNWLSGTAAKDPKTGSPQGVWRYSLNQTSWSDSVTGLTANPSEPTTVTVYYYLQGQGNYLDSQIGELKVAFGNGVPTLVSVPTPNTWTYDGKEHYLLNDIGTVNNGVMHVCINGSTNDDFTTKEGLGQRIDVPTLYDGVGYYYEIKYWITGNAGYTNLDGDDFKVKVYVNKCQADWATPATFQNLTYNPNVQSNSFVVNKGSANEIAGTTISTGTPYFRLEKQDGTVIAGGNQYTSNIGEITYNTPGDYVIRYYIKAANNNFTDSSEITYTVKVNTATASVGTAPTALSTTYDPNKSQSLFKTAGSDPVGGTLRYRLVSYKNTSGTTTSYTTSDEEGKWVTLITDARLEKVWPAGTYTIKYQIISNTANYGNSAEKQLTATIAQKEASATTRPDAWGLTYGDGDESLFGEPGTAGAGSKLQYRIIKKIINGTETVVNAENTTNGWKDNYKDSSLQPSAVGTYVVQWRAVPNNNANYKNGVTETLTVRVGMGTAQLLNERLPKGKGNLKYNGNEQILIDLDDLASNVKISNGTIMFKFKDETDDSSWRDANQIKGLNPGDYLIDCKVVGSDNYNDSQVYTMDPVTIGLGEIGNYVAPVKKSNLKYNGNDQSLLEAGGSTEHGGEIEIMYSLNGGADWKTPGKDNFKVSDLKGKEVGTYTISWYINGCGKYESTNVEVITVAIDRATATLRVGTLAARKQNGEDLIYNGNSQQLFSGAATVTGNGQIYYAITTSDLVAPSSSDESTDITSLTKEDACDNLGNQYTYYLWYRAVQSTSYNAVSWKYSGVSTQIDRATYSVSVTTNPDTVYDGLSHEIFVGDPSVVADSGLSADLVDVKYRLTYLRFEDNSDTVTVTTASEVCIDKTLPDLKLMINTNVVNAGVYILYANWTTNGIAPATQINANSTYVEIARMKVSKANTSNGVAVIGLNGETSIVIDNTGTAKPFSKVTPNIDLRFNNNANNNGISTNNSVGNKLSYAWIATAGEPGSFTTCAAAGLNGRVKELIANRSGTWHLWFKVDHHYNIASGVMFEAVTVTVNGYTLASNELKGLTMTGADDEKLNGSAVYNGSQYSLVEDGNAVGVIYENLNIGTPYYGISESATVLPQNWVGSVTDLPTRTEVGTYYLWVKWDEGTNVAASTGLVYAKFDITKLSNVGSLFFSGIVINNDKFKALNSTSEIYNTTYSNSEMPVVKTQPTINVYDVYDVKDAPTNLASDFGNITLGISTREDTMDGYYYSLGEYRRLVVENVGTYYIWIKWDGGKNVYPGSEVYQVTGNQTVVTLRVNELGNTNNVRLRNNGAIASNTNDAGHEFQYVFSGNSFSQVGQSLFEKTNDPILEIEGAIYNGIVTYQYLLVNVVNYGGVNEADKPSLVSSMNEWSDTIESAKQSAVGTYDLWVKYTINNTNLNISKCEKLGSATIIATSSFAMIAPTPITGLVTDGESEQVLINASTQDAPSVEYSLDPTDNLSWKSNAADIKGVNAGTYFVYYRGAAHENEFTTEVRSTYPEIEYSYITVVINRTNAAINESPEAKEVYFTGLPISSEFLFTNGSAKVGADDNLPLLYSWTGNQNEFYSYGAVELAKQNAGTYVLYFMPDLTNVGNADPEYSATMSITVEIKKVDVDFVTPVFDNHDRVYKAEDYHVFSGPVNYFLLSGKKGANDTHRLKVNGVDVDYTTYGEGENFGTMGKVWYAVSTSASVQPSDWYDDYSLVAVRQVDTYYRWVKVDSGDNHNASVVKCFNGENEQIKIVAAGKNDVRLVKTTYDVLKSNNGEMYRYDGLKHNMVDNLVLVVEFANYNDNGIMTLNNTGSFYNANVNDRLGNIYYALTSNENDAPINYNEENGWYTSWQALTKKDCGTYHLWIRFEGTAGSCIGTFNECFSNVKDVNGENREAIEIAKAKFSDLSITGISRSVEMFTGKDLFVKDGRLASGTPIVMINTTRVDIGGEIDWNSVRYAFWWYPLRGNNQGNNPSFNQLNWKYWDNDEVTEENLLKEKKVGRYQLYIKLAVSSNNIEVETPLIYTLFNENALAEITPADEHYIDVVAPIFYGDLIYNGQEQRLIKNDAGVVMQKGDNLGNLIGMSGTPWYYISEDVNEQPDGSEDEWYDNYMVDIELQRKLAGTYYVWVKFTEGESHTAILPHAVGTVVIAQATEQGIELSGLELADNLSYTGNLHQLIKNATGFKQKFISGNSNVELVRGVDYESIWFAYSNDPEVAPTQWTAENDVAEIKACNADTYYIWVKVVGTTNVATYVKRYVVNSFVSDDAVDILPAVLINDYFYGINPHEGLSYIGRNQILAHLDLNAQNKLSIIIDDVDVNTTDYNDHIVISWGLGSGEGNSINSINAPAENAWVNDLNDVTVMRRNAGTYYLWVRVTGCKNIRDYAACCAIILVDKATIEFVAPEYHGDGNNVGLTYTGAEQELLTSDATLKFHPYSVECPYYAEDEYYDVDAGLVVRYGFTENLEKGSNYHNLKKINASNYTVYYGVIAGENDNWYSSIKHITVKIDSRDASEPVYSLLEAPGTMYSLEYNEAEQDLISFGRLAQLPANSISTLVGSALEGSQIIFWYVNANGERVIEEGESTPREYRYYYDRESGSYTWVGGEETGKLPKRINAGTYYIRYIVTGTENGNYKDSDEKSLQVEIAKRRVYWERNPKAMHGLQYTGEEQVIVDEGRLNVGKNASGVTVMYSVRAKKMENRAWQSTIPMAAETGVWFVYYYVEVDDNNVFVGSEKNSATTGELIKGISIERFVLTIRNDPSPRYLQYTAEPQNLVENGELSTDYATFNNAIQLPHFYYSFDNVNWSQDKLYPATGDCNTYTIYWKLVYEPTIFDFRSEKDCGEFEATIHAVTFGTDSVRAVYNADTKKLDVVMGEGYSEKLKEKIINSVVFEYCVFDDYHPVIWKEWLNGDNNTECTKLGLGTYQFRLSIQDAVNGNFRAYTQEGINTPLDHVSITEDRTVYIFMEDYYTLPKVRVWIDFTGNMTYEDYDDMPEEMKKYRYEGQLTSSQVDPDNDKYFCFFQGVNSTGRNDAAVIRIQTIGTGSYYRSTNDDYINKTYRESHAVNWTEEGSYVERYKGLPDKDVVIRLYEVYHIEYDANGAVPLESGVAPTEGWKWHGIDYKLDNNVYRKEAEDHELLLPKGWNTTRACNGSEYKDGEWYDVDSSQIFYAQFYNKDDVHYRIDWIITDGITTYRYANVPTESTSRWFNAATGGNRVTGVDVLEGDLIVLPQIVAADNNNKFWSDVFAGKYIKGWRMAPDGWTVEDGIDEDLIKSLPEYYVDMKATSKITFVAELVSQTGSVQCDVKVDNGKLINSCVVADGAKAYMALSGIDETRIKNYREGYDAWVQNYGNRTLHSSSGLPIVYNLGTKSVTNESGVDNNKDDMKESNTMNDYATMFIILAAGAITTITTLSVYMILRKKNRPVNLKKFREEK